jgi:ubiquinone/menaquinone biosynthesis C-methylase UbiE
VLFTRSKRGGVDPNKAFDMTFTKTRQADVQKHYRALAPQYAARANQTCERTYERLVRRFLEGRKRLLELGGGSSALLGSLGGSTAVACDLSLEMLRMRPAGDRAHRVGAIGERLPFRDASFDGLFSINVLEHVTGLGAVMSESARVLSDGGLWLAITPNGNWEFLLDLAERCKLKIPEGPHAFLKTQQLRSSVRAHFEVLEHKTFLVLPAGPSGLSRLVDRLTPTARLGWGFFQYIVAKKATPNPVN